MVVDERLQVLLEQGEELGCLNLSAVSEFLQEAELDDDQTTGFFEQLEERRIVLTDDCARPDAVENTYVNGDLAVATTDALQLFLNEAGRYKLLTASEEVELAKRIERGDKQAKDLMINSNLRLVVRSEERRIVLTDDCARPDAVENTYVNGDLAVATTDALQLFLNEAGRYKLLTASEEVELAKRIERGDKQAKDLMINSNLRLVV